MKSVSVILFILFSLSFHHCQEKKSLVGNYSSPDNTKLNYLRYGSRALGLELKLNADSTFVFSTCAQISEGQWKYQDEKLILNCREKRMKIDSLNHLPQYEKGRICGRPTIFEVNGVKLHFTEKYENEKELRFLLFKKD